MSAVLKLKVNEKALIKNLKLAFTSSTTYIDELIQNARRAKATRVDIWYDKEHRALYVKDDGIGIDDMQSLLSVAESGWDEQTCSEETPYGIGFLSALFQADAVKVASGNQVLEFNTHEVLSFESVEAKKMAEGVKGTLIRLVGVNDPNLRQDFARGFPIPVTYNGQEMKRNDALDILGPVHTNECIDDESEVDEEGEDDIEFVEA